MQFFWAFLSRLIALAEIAKSNRSSKFTVLKVSYDYS